MQNLKDQIQAAAKTFVQTWNQKTESNISLDLTHKFDLKGKTAGQFFPNKNGGYLRWNMQAAEKYTEDYLINTVGHEIAHYINHKNSPQAQPHGTAWKVIMMTIGLVPERCHHYNLAPARTVARNYKYSCPCGVDMDFTSVKAKRIIKSAIYANGDTTYYCRRCGKPINKNDIKNLNSAQDAVRAKSALDKLDPKVKEALLKAAANGEL